MERRVPADWRNIHLSEHFVMSEFVVSDSYPHLAEMMEPTLEQFNNLYTLCQLALEPIRVEYGFVSITSGLRSIELNEKIGGVAVSQHLYGEAADFTCPTVSMLDVFTFCAHNLKWSGELIYYKKKNHCHIALPSPWAVPDRKIIDS